MRFYTFSPICVPINWQTELITDTDQKFQVLSSLLKDLSTITVNPCSWPTGYGSLEHDNLPLFYQPAAEISLLTMMQEEDVVDAQLYCYDNCLAILSVSLETSFDLTNIDDLAISHRIEALSQQYLKPILSHLYEQKSTGHLISPKAYKFYADSEATLCEAKPLWVARMLVQAPSLSPSHYQQWLQNVDDTSDLFLLGSGNSLLRDQAHLLDIQRVMMLAQFHAALMLRTEELLKQTLTQSNGAYFNNDSTNDLQDSVELHQYRNDHIEFINIQYSAAQAGIQGKRRQLLTQFTNAWHVQEQEQRLHQLAQLVQKRIDRHVDEKKRGQTRSIQTVLTFLGALSLVAIVIDLASLGHEIKHNDTLGVLDIFTLMSAENVLSITIFAVIILTAYFYKNHE